MRGEARRDQAHVCLGGAAAGDGRAAHRAAELREPAAVLAVCADDAGAHGVLGEQGGLGAEVGLHGLVVVQVVLGEVGEGGHGKARAQDAAEVDGLARDLERRHTHAGFRHLREHHLEVAALGSGVQRRAHLTADVALHRAHEARGLARNRRHVLHEEGGGGLAVGAGHAHQAQLLAGLPVEACAAQGEGH